MTFHLKDEVFQTEANSSNYRTTTTDFNLQVIGYFLQQEGKKIYRTEMIMVNLRRVAAALLTGHEGREAAGCGGGSWRGRLWVPFSHHPPNLRPLSRPQDCNSQTLKYPALGGEHFTEILHRRKIFWLVSVLCSSVCISHLNIPQQINELKRIWNKASAAV